jgi:two-component system alkaline phosphatase synthesis response regulator PhoP
MKTILIVDDSASVRRLLEEYLTGQGFRAVMAVNGREAIYAARHEQPDLILLDLMMPEMDGYEFLRRYRQERQTPVIIITAREEEADAVRELVSRIHAVLRRSDGESAPARVLRSGELVVDETTRTVSLRGAPVHLTHTEFDLLALLMAAPGRVFTRAQLVERLADSGFVGAERTLNVHVRNLRAKLESDDDSPEYIETVFGVGYRFRQE